ncbi:resolvase family protein [delta proteobacterium NaphS2]|nr:resolvase family protein [delta proteobacterium NaphS2]
MGKSKKDDRQIIGYLRVSTEDQDLEKFKADIRAYANSKDFGKVSFVQEKVSGYKTSWKDRKVKTLIDELRHGDIIITPEMTRLGRSTLEVLEVLEAMKNKGIAVYSVKENYQLNGDDMQSKMMSTMLSMFAEMERHYNSVRTKEGLRAARAKGKLLGRPKGPGKSKLDIHREEIVALLSNGSTKKYVADRYSTTAANLQNWLKKNKIKIDLN